MRRRFGLNAIPMPTTPPETSNEGLSTVGRGELVGAGTGLAFVALFGAGLISADLLASPAFYEVDASGGRIDAFFVDNRPEAVALCVCHALAAIALLAFGGHVGGVLRRYSGHADGLAAVALAGATVAAAFLLLSALLFWTLTRPQVAQGDPGTAEALLVLSYLAGGPGVALPLAPFLAATSLAGLRARLLPRSLSRAGLAASVLCLASVAGFAGDPTGDARFDPGLGDLGLGLVVAAMLTALAWIATASILLPGRRTS
jgi:hypothetical protein